jgi:glutathione S-transferase
MTQQLPKLFYFDGKGFGELSRLVFAAAGAPFEDVRFDATDDDDKEAVGNTTLKFDEFKKTTPYGQVPLLELPNGVKIAQSRAIARYLAREHGLFGRTVIEGAQIDSVFEQIRDLQSAFYKYYEQPPAEHAAFKKNYIAQLGGKAASLARVLEQSGTGFFVGSSLSLADIAFFNVFHDLFEPVDPATFAADVPAVLIAHIKAIGAIPAIAKWVAARPKRAW